MDSIIIRGISLVTHIGVPDAERANQQQILVDIEVLHPMQQAGSTDDVGNSIDYAAVTACVQTLQKTERKTVERLATDIASAILQKFRPSGGVRVTVTKKPKDLKIASVSVTVQRP
jgi:7,8-dihydroneopterin aldolase/epimerase/oxygenase